MGKILKETVFFREKSTWLKSTMYTQKWFGSAVCVRRHRKIVYIVSESADPNHFRGTAGKMITERLQTYCKIH